MALGGMAFSTPPDGGDAQVLTLPIWDFARVGLAASTAARLWGSRLVYGRIPLMCAAGTSRMDGRRRIVGECHPQGSI